MYERSFLEWMQKLELLESYFFYLDKLHNTQPMYFEQGMHLASANAFLRAFDILKHFLAIL